MLEWTQELDVSDIDVDFVIKPEYLTDFYSLNHTRSDIKSEKLRYLYNKNNIKNEFDSIGFNTPKLYHYSTEKFNIEEFTKNLDKCVIKPAHMSLSDWVAKKTQNKIIFKNSSNKIDNLNDFNRCLYLNCDNGEPEMLKKCEKGILIEELIEVKYEVKVFVVWGCPLIVDLRTGSTELNRVDFIFRENDYFNWDKEYELIKKFAKKIAIDFFRIDFLYDGDKLYASECAFMPSTILPDEVEEILADFWKSPYLTHYYPFLA